MLTASSKVGLAVIYDIFELREVRLLTMSAADIFVTIINLLTKDAALKINP